MLHKGPYQTKLPINLDKQDKYKYALKVLLDNSFTAQSSKVLDKLGFSYTVLKKTDVEKHDMKGIKLESYFITRNMCMQQPLAHSSNISLENPSNIDNFSKRQILLTITGRGHAVKKNPHKIWLQINNPNCL